MSVGPLTQLLIKARQRIAKEENWGRGAYARNAAGYGVDVLAPEAVCWCAVGALEAECKHHMPSWLVMGKPKIHPIYQPAHLLLQQAAAKVVGPGRVYSITVVNDSMGHEAVVRMYNIAIKEAKGK